MRGRKRSEPDPRCVDLLGRTVLVMDCPYDVEGVVVGETRNTFLIISRGRRVVVPKLPCTFLVYSDCWRLVRGRWLIGYRDVRLSKCR